MDQREWEDVFADEMRPQRELRDAEYLITRGDICFWGIYAMVVLAIIACNIVAGINEATRFF